jgi:hypothetical protein
MTRVAAWIVAMAFASSAALAQGPTPPLADALVGTWRSPGCEASQPDAPVSLKRVFEADHSTWRVKVTFYSGSKCATALFGVAVDGTYSLGAASSTVEGAMEGTFHYSRKTAWALSEEGASRLAAAKCGSGPWRPGLEQDVSATGCLAFPPIAESCLQEFDLVSIANGSLRFGSRRPEMCRPAGRPTTLSANPLVRSPER